MSRGSSPISSSSSSSGDDIIDEHEEEELPSDPATCLACPAVLASVEAALGHMKDVHAFDLISAARTHGACGACVRWLLLRCDAVFDVEDL